jgi:hypothetical protein
MVQKLLAYLHIMFSIMSNEYLKEITINNPNTIISDSPILKKSEQIITIYGYRNSTAESFVTDYNNGYSYHKEKLRFSSLDKDWQYTVNADGRTATITKYTGANIKTVVIPSNIDGYAITHIGGKIFFEIGVEYIVENIIIPNGVIEIGSTALANCSYLNNIQIPSSVTKIGDYAFANSFNLKNVTLPDGINEMGEGAFSNSGITNINIPKSLSIIRMNSFTLCDNLVSITIPANVVEIEDGAFALCSELRSAYISNKSIKIHPDAFSLVHSDFQIIMN